MLVIFELISAGLIISLINKYIFNTKIPDQCMQERGEDEEYELSSVVAGVSDSSCVHHVHI